MLKYRLITALILIPIVIAALFLLPPLAFALVTLVVCMLAAWEWGQLAGFTSRSQRIWLAILCGFLLALMMLSVPAYHQSVPQVSGSLWLSLVWWLAALLLVLFYPGSAAIWRNSRPLRLLFGLLTIVPFFWGMLALRQYGYEQNPFTGAWWLLYVMLLVWGADSGAYMFGKLFGKHKLAPKVSPGKTWEGLIGGLLTSAVISLAVRPLCATERGADHPVGLFGARRAGFGAGRFDRKHVQTRSGYQGQRSFDPRSWRHTGSYRQPDRGGTGVCLPDAVGVLIRR